MANFRNLYEYIQNATVTETGIHDPWPESSIYPKYRLHIYSSKLQVNITKAQDSSDPDGVSVANFIFRPTEGKVCVYRVEDGTCDYDTCTIIDMSTEISRSTGWCNCLKTPGTINEVLRDILGSGR